VGDDETGNHPETSDQEHAAADDLERQAREAVAQIRARIGDLGGRVRRVVERAGAHWEASAVAPTPSTEIAVEAGERARVLARRWVDIDFLVERSELHRRDQPAQGAPPVDVWAYEFPATPEIEAGERRERLPTAGGVYSCAACQGGGRRSCGKCEGRGFDICPRCRGSAHLTCPRCRGRGRVPITPFEPLARQSASHLHRHAERLATEAGERIVGFAEHLRQDRGVSPPPSSSWSPAGPHPGETIACPNCTDGTVPCDCEQGKRRCATCAGSGQEACPICKGTGHLSHYREIVRRFDTRLSTRSLPLEGAVAQWVPDDVLARGVGARAWYGARADLTVEARPPDVPQTVWEAVMAFAQAEFPVASPSAIELEAPAERRVLSCQVSVQRVPLVRMEYEFGGSHYVVVAFGAPGAERFWAETRTAGVALGAFCALSR